MSEMNQCCDSRERMPEVLEQMSELEQKINHLVELQHETQSRLGMVLTPPVPEAAGECKKDPLCVSRSKLAEGVAELISQVGSGIRIATETLDRLQV